MIPEIGWLFLPPNFSKKKRRKKWEKTNQWEGQEERSQHNKTGRTKNEGEP